MRRLKDIAQKAGVSITTVSQVLNGKGTFSPATIERVLKAAKSYGYNPPRSWKSRNTVGIVVPDILDPYYTSVVKFAGHFLEKEGYSLVLFDTDNSIGREQTMIKSAARQAKGVIFCPNPGGGSCISEWLSCSNYVPLVCFNVVVPDNKVSYVTVDNFNGAKTAVSYLVSKGRKRIVYLRGTFDRDRFAGYVKALEEKGLDLSDELVVDCGYTYHAGYTSVFHLLKNKVDFDGIFACNDLAALGAIECLKSQGISVPEKVSVVGFDDIWFASIYTPKLTTMRQPLYDMCKLAVNILLRAFEDENFVKQEIVQPHLVIRDSA